MRRELELRGRARRTSARDSITGGKGNARAFVKPVGAFDEERDRVERQGETNQRTR